VIAEVKGGLADSPLHHLHTPSARTAYIEVRTEPRWTAVNYRNVGVWADSGLV
jgi:hypothetical protein